MNYAEKAIHAEESDVVLQKVVQEPSNKKQKHSMTKQYLKKHSLNHHEKLRNKTSYLWEGSKT